MAKGRKFDGGKLRYDLLPMGAIEAIVEALTFGAAKYADNNWQKIDDIVERYSGSMLRHISKFRQGEELDSDSGLHHMSHAACCAIFILWQLQKEGRVPAGLDFSEVRKRYEKIRKASGLEPFKKKRK